MTRRSILFAALGLCCIANVARSQEARSLEAETQKTKPVGSPVVLPGAEQFDLTAKSGLVYRIYLAVPAGKAPERGFPVIYLTDANGNFPILLSAVRRQTMGEAQAVVVGIGYPTEDRREQSERRSFDLTPAASEEWLKTLPPGGPPLGKSGGNDQFLEFLQSELKPVIEQKAPIDRSRQALFGHSFGGLFVLHVLFNRADSFQTYLASSPSVWWNGRSVLSEEQAFTKLFADKPLTARLLITVGEWEEAAGPGVPETRAVMLKQRQMVTSARGLADRLTRAGIDGFQVAIRVFDEEDHGSVVLPSASQAARFALESESRGSR